MTHDSQRSLSRFTLENLKLRRLEDEGETYDVDKTEAEPEAVSDEAEDDSPTDPNNLNFSDVEHAKHNRDASKSALTYWRHEESKNKIDSMPKRNQQYQNLEKPGMGLELECLSSFVTAANNTRILNKFYKTDSTPQTPPQ